MATRISRTSPFVLAIILGSCMGGRMPASGTPVLAPHPRLRVNDSKLTDIKNLVHTTEYGAKVYQDMLAYGKTLLTAPVVNCSLAGVEHSLLTQARSVLDRTYTLGLLYRLDTTNTDAAKRAIKEMIHVTNDSSCSSWNPSHFLDTAEMMHAVAIGLDWLYDAPAEVLSLEERKIIEAGLAKRGLGAAADSWSNDEFVTPYNWNLVCNGGMIAASLILLDSDVPEQASLASSIYKNATEHIRISLLSTYGPDGAWPEGPTYWGYATKYALVAIELLTTATGNDQGLGDALGFGTTGAWRIQNTSPLNRMFNWGDSDDNGADEFLTNFFALGNQYHADNQQLYSWFGSQVYEASGYPQLMEGYALTLINLKLQGSSADLEALPTCKSYRLNVSGWNNEIALGYFRSDWRGTMWNVTDSAPVTPHPTYIAFKGGNGQANHNDVDAGTFVLDMAGHRWAVDLGADSYGLPGYFSKSSRHGARYSYYRKSTIGQNTLTFNGWENQPGWSAQDDTTVAGISSFSCGKDPFATLDLTPVYIKSGGPSPITPPTSQVVRGFSVVQSFSRVLIRDEWKSPGAKNVTWSMHFHSHDTKVLLSTDKKSATLVALKSDLVPTPSIVATIDSPTTASFDLMVPTILPPQNDVGDLMKLVVVLDPKLESQLGVSFALPGTPPLPGPVNQLSDWVTKGSYSLD